MASDPLGVHLIAAVGLSGQIGLDGKVPWHGDARYVEHTKRDLAEFKRLTDGGTIIIGSVTAYGAFPAAQTGGWLTGERRIEVWRRGSSPMTMLQHLRSKDPTRNIWICGGQKVYELFIPYVDWHHISVIPYDGPADRWIPPIIPGWRSVKSLGYPLGGKV